MTEIEIDFPYSSFPLHKLENTTYSSEPLLRIWGRVENKPVGPVRLVPTSRNRDGACKWRPERIRFERLPPQAIATSDSHERCAGGDTGLQFRLGVIADSMNLFAPGLRQVFRGVA